MSVDSLEKGVEVIKIERPQGGYLATGNSPLISGESSCFLGLNRGKRSIALNPSTLKGKELCLKLVKHADVVVENFLPCTP